MDIRIITPHIPDKWYVHEVRRAHYPFCFWKTACEFMNIPGFIHAETFCCDDQFGVVGAINLDYRSLYFHDGIPACGCMVLTASPTSNTILSAPCGKAGNYTGGLPSCSLVPPPVARIPSSFCPIDVKNFCFYLARVLFV